VASIYCNLGHRCSPSAPLGIGHTHNNFSSRLKLGLREWLAQKRGVVEVRGLCKVESLMVWVESCESGGEGSGNVGSSRKEAERLLLVVQVLRCRSLMPYDEDAGKVSFTRQVRDAL
jgi:hypothetical protein